jgi:hypothetical protein
MPHGNHKTVPVQVWADIDVAIVDVVKHLNTIEGVRTLASCQGTIGEGGPNPYRAQVMVTWANEEAHEILKREYELEELGVAWGYAHPREEKK